MSANLGAHALIDIETSAPTGEEALPEEEPVTRISVGTAASAHAGFTALKLAQEAWPWLPAAAPQQPAAEAAPVQELAVAVQEVQPAAEPARTAAAHGRRLTGMLRNQLTDHAFSDYIFAVDGCLHPRNHLEVLQPDGDLLSHDILRRAFAREQGWFSMKDSRQSAEAQADQREREMAAVRARILEHWPQADGNADGMLDQNEVVALYQQHLAERARSFLSEHPDSDLDQDGQLEEFEIIAQARKVRHQRMQARLAGRPDLDLDGDGLPSVAEYVEYLKRRADERKSRARDEQRTLCCAMRAGRLANLPGGAAVCESGLCCSAFFQVTCDDFESGRLEIDDILDEFELLDPRNNEKSGCLKRLGQLPDDRPPEMPDFKIRPQLSPFHVQGQR
jgi:hypothetical protein